MISRRNSLQIFGLLISILLTGVGVYGILLQFRTGTTVGDELIRQILLLGEGAFAIIGSLFLMLFFRNTPSPGVLFLFLPYKRPPSARSDPYLPHFSHSIIHIRYLPQ